jgi:hypothetical protein
MKRVYVRTSLVAVVTVIVLTAALLPLARSQVQVAASYIPIGVAASGSSSTAWFHQPSSGRVMACQSIAQGGAAIANIQCVTTKLP